MASLMTTLDSIVQAYRDDSEFQAKQQDIVVKRENSLPHYKAIVEQFIDGVYTLDSFRNALKILHQETFWGAHTPGFLMELNKLANNHITTNNDLEANLRFILKDMNAQNVGQRIEQFYKLLTQEKKRLEGLGMPDGKIVSPGNSAFIISLLAFWTDRPGEPYICYPSLRVSLGALLTAKLFPIPTDINLGKRIDITSDAEYQVVKHILDQLAVSQPMLKTDAYWAESFLSWIKKQLNNNPGFLKNIYVIVETEETAEDEATLAIDAKSTLLTIEDKPLAPTPEPLLTQLIIELRRHILVDEALVRRIYFDLLGGHVILTGPPGTGKTELARLIPELLWQSEENIEQISVGDQSTKRLTMHTAYTTTLVTATSEWSTRTLISSITPVISAEKVSYRTQYGHLTHAILRNWSVDHTAPERWEKAQRVRLRANSVCNGQEEQEFHGHWLIIDEFNRASIDIAMGEALTALSTGEPLNILVEGKNVKLPLPRDFRIIGTLNSFDRNYLNQISEALKRRFAFIEVPPPSRAQRKAEQTMVLYKALKEVEHISDAITVDRTEVTWQDVVFISSDSSGEYQDEWESAEHPLRRIFYEVAWPLFEVIRIYRQLGTAQAIAFVRQMLIPGILQQFNGEEQWMIALDNSLCDIIADQLQVILPDELDILLWCLKLDRDTFIRKYNNFIVSLVNKRRRLNAHIEALHTIINVQGEPLLTDEEAERLLDEEEEEPQLAAEVLTEAFHLDHPAFKLPQFVHRLRTFKAERGL